jgi:transporter family protein
MDQKTFILWLLTLLCWGISPTIEKVGLRRIQPLTGLLIRTFAALLGITLTILLTNSLQNLKTVGKKDILYLGLSGITAGFLGMYFYFSLLKIHQASQVVTLTATYPLVATFLALLILKEPLSLNKILGTFFIALGIYLLFKNSS